MPQATSPVEKLEEGPSGLQQADRAARWNWRTTVLGLVALVAAAVLLWEGVLEYRFVAKRWGVVEPGSIYRSGQVSKWLIGDVLQSHNIQVIIDMNGIESDDEHQQQEIQVARERNIELHRCQLGGDGTGDVQSYAEALKVLADSQEAGKPVLVHCSAGAQRTGGVVAFYRLLIQGRPPAFVYNEMQEYGWDPVGDRVLLDYINDHMAELANLLVSNGVLERVPDPLPVLGP